MIYRPDNRSPEVTAAPGQGWLFYAVFCLTLFLVPASVHGKETPISGLVNYGDCISAVTIGETTPDALLFAATGTLKPVLDRRYNTNNELAECYEKLRFPEEQFAHLCVNYLTAERQIEQVCPPVNIESDPDTVYDDKDCYAWKMKRFLSEFKLADFFGRTPASPRFSFLSRDMKDFGETYEKQWFFNNFEGNSYLRLLDHKSSYNEIFLHNEKDARRTELIFSTFKREIERLEKQRSYYHLWEQWMTETGDFSRAKLTGISTLCLSAPFPNTRNSCICQADPDKLTEEQKQQPGCLENTRLSRSLISAVQFTDERLSKFFDFSKREYDFKKIEMRSLWLEAVKLFFRYDKDNNNRDTDKIICDVAQMINSHEELAGCGSTETGGEGGASGESDFIIGIEYPGFLWEAHRILGMMYEIRAHLLWESNKNVLYASDNEYTRSLRAALRHYFYCIAISESTRLHPGGEYSFTEAVGGEDAAYESAVRILLDIGRTADALKISDMLRGRFITRLTEAKKKGHDISGLLSIERSIPSPHDFCSDYLKSDSHPERNEEQVRIALTELVHKRNSSMEDIFSDLNKTIPGREKCYLAPDTYSEIERKTLSQFNIIEYLLLSDRLITFTIPAVHVNSEPKSCRHISVFQQEVQPRKLQELADEHYRKHLGISPTGKKPKLEEGESISSILLSDETLCALTEKAPIAIIESPKLQRVLYHVLEIEGWDGGNNCGKSLVSSESGNKFLLNYFPVFYVPSLKILENLASQKDIVQATKNIYAGGYFSRFLDPTSYIDTVNKVTGIIMGSSPSSGDVIDLETGDKYKKSYLWTLYKPVDSDHSNIKSGKESSVWISMPGIEPAPGSSLLLLAHNELSEWSPIENKLILGEDLRTELYENTENEIIRNDKGQNAGITMGEIAGMKLPYRLVFLYSCTTEKGENAGIEGDFSFSDAFLVAGASAILGTEKSLVLDETNVNLFAENFMRFYEKALAEGGDIFLPEIFREAALINIDSPAWGFFKLTGF